MVSNKILLNSLPGPRLSLRLFHPSLELANGTAHTVLSSPSGTEGGGGKKRVPWLPLIGPKSGLSSNGKMVAELVRATGRRMTVARRRKTGWEGSREGLGSNSKGDVARAPTRRSVFPAFIFTLGAERLLRREASPVTKKNKNATLCISGH